VGQPLHGVPLKVQVVLSRYQGDKKISALPFTMSVNAVNPGETRFNQTNVRMGAQIPVEVLGGEGKIPSFQYKDVGTSIDCNAATIDDGRFKLTLSIEDSSVYGDERSGAQSDLKAVGRLPAFRSFKTTEFLILRDGQSQQYTTATDKISGEVVKVDVTLNVIK
jgi:hypothetical protein